MLAFTFVRHPLSRLVSCFRYFFRDGEESNPREHNRIGQDFDLPPDADFARFLRCVCRQPDDESDPHYRSQHWHCYGDNDVFTHILRFERLEADWRVVQGLFRERGLAVPDLTHQHPAGPAIDWRDYYTEETAAMARRRYQKDFETFSFE